MRSASATPPFNQGANRQDGLSRMITGIFDDKRGLLVRVQVSDGGRPYHEIECAIAPSADVGLALPRRYITELGLFRVGEIDWMLGGIQQQNAPYYIAYVEWVRGLSPAFVVETPGEPLIGQGLLRGSFLRADFMDGGEVAVYGID